MGPYSRSYRAIMTTLMMTSNRSKLLEIHARYLAPNPNSCTRGSRPEASGCIRSVIGSPVEADRGVFFPRRASRAEGMTLTSATRRKSAPASDACGLERNRARCRLPSRQRGDRPRLRGLPVLAARSSRRAAPLAGVADKAGRELQVRVPLSRRLCRVASFHLAARAPPSPRRRSPSHTRGARSFLFFFLLLLSSFFFFIFAPRSVSVYEFSPERVERSTRKRVHGLRTRNAQSTEYFCAQVRKVCPIRFPLTWDNWRR